jgi:hypothetical protein
MAILMRLRLNTLAVLTLYNATFILVDIWFSLHNYYYNTRTETAAALYTTIIIYYNIISRYPGSRIMIYISVVVYMSYTTNIIQLRDIMAIKMSAS